MGYELHIVRRNDWDDFEEDSNISLDEWLAYVKNDKEILLTNSYQPNFPTIDTAIKGRQGFCYWTAHPTYKDNEKPWLDYGHGCISTKFPDDETIKKMIAVAAILDAKVQGDDNEYYDHSYFDAKQDTLTTPKTDIKQHLTAKPWWKFW